jgi:hypothetical protein
MHNREQKISLLFICIKGTKRISCIIRNKIFANVNLQQSQKILLHTFQEFAPDEEKIASYKTETLLSKGEKFFYNLSNNLHHTKK